MDLEQISLPALVALSSPGKGLIYWFWGLQNGLRELIHTPHSPDVRQATNTSSRSVLPHTTLALETHTSYRSSQNQRTQFISPSLTEQRSPRTVPTNKPPLSSPPPSTQQVPLEARVASLPCSHPLAYYSTVADHSSSLMTVLNNI